MEVTHSRIRVDPFLEAQAVPVDVLRRTSNDKWIISTSPLTTTGPPEFAYAKTGEGVVVPLVPYQVRAAPASAFGFLMAVGIQAGLKLADELRARGVQPERLHLSLGDKVEQLTPEVVRFYGGFAIKVR